MLPRIARALVALALTVAIPVTAWAACGSGLPFARAKSMCHTPASVDGHCQMAQMAKQGDEIPDCCKVKKEVSQPFVLIAPPTTPDLDPALAAGDVERVDVAAIALVPPSIDRAWHVPLKLPHDPTYLRISVLLV
jgi:hypothetical protein